MLHRRVASGHSAYASAEKALKRLPGEKPEVALVDVNLPVPEESEILCNVAGKPTVSKLAMRFDYYGGHRDLQALEVDLCEEVAENVLKLLQSKYPQIQIVEAEMLSDMDDLVLRFDDTDAGK